MREMAHFQGRIRLLTEAKIDGHPDPTLLPDRRMAVRLICGDLSKMCTNVRILSRGK